MWIMWYGMRRWYNPMTWKLRRRNSLDELMAEAEKEREKEEAAAGGGNTRVAADANAVRGSWKLSTSISALARGIMGNKVGPEPDKANGDYPVAGLPTHNAHKGAPDMGPRAALPVSTSPPPIMPPSGQLAFKSSRQNSGANIRTGDDSASAAGRPKSPASLRPTSPPMGNALKKGGGGVGSDDDDVDDDDDDRGSGAASVSDLGGRSSDADDSGADATKVKQLLAKSGSDNKDLRVAAPAAIQSSSRGGSLDKGGRGDAGAGAGGSQGGASGSSGPWPDPRHDNKDLGLPDRPAPAAEGVEAGRPASGKRSGGGGGSRPGSAAQRGSGAGGGAGELVREADEKAGAGKEHAEPPCVVPSNS